MAPPPSPQPSPALQERECCVSCVVGRAQRGGATEMKLKVVSLGESAPGEGFSVRESAPGKVFSLRESPPGAARQRVTFLAGTRKVTKRSALQYKRTFDRASEPGPLTPPLEFRLEMRSVCAVALSPTAAPRYGSASRTAQQSDVHASRRRRASAAGLLVSATTAAPVSRSLGGTQGTAHADRICSTAPGIKRQAALALREREA